MQKLQLQNYEKIKANVAGDDASKTNIVHGYNCIILPYMGIIILYW